MDYVIIHSGVKGQKWGERRYQNPDGTYTEEGKARRRQDDSPEAKVARSERNKKLAKVAALTTLSIAALSGGAYALNKSGALKTIKKNANVRLSAIKNPRQAEIAKLIKERGSMHPDARAAHDVWRKAKGDVKKISDADAANAFKRFNLENNLKKSHDQGIKKKVGVVGGMAALAGGLATANNLYNQARNTKQNVDREVDNIKKRKQKKNQ